MVGSFPNIRQTLGNTKRKLGNVYNQKKYRVLAQVRKLSALRKETCSGFAPSLGTRNQLRTADHISCLLFLWSHLAMARSFASAQEIAADPMPVWIWQRKAERENNPTLGSCWVSRICEVPDLPLFLFFPPKNRRSLKKVFSPFGPTTHLGGAKLEESQVSSNSEPFTPGTSPPQKLAWALAWQGPQSGSLLRSLWSPLGDRGFDGLRDATSSQPA